MIDAWPEERLPGCLHDGPLPQEFVRGAALLAENARLREENARLKQQLETLKEPPRP